MTRTLLAVVAAAAIPLSAWAQSPDNARFADTVRQVSQYIGEMAVSLDAGDRLAAVTDRLRFEPYQQIEDMFLRDDVVFLMRHGPTDWSKLDVKEVAPTDCARQRIMSPEGARNMRDFGALLASNEVLPSMIVVSQWCRNQQTLQHMFEGFDLVDPAIAAEMPVETDPEINLLLSLQGAKNVDALRNRISAWKGHPTRRGPLLIITHYTNIEELTQFRVFEGEFLVLDPKRDNQVLGYVRLQSAHPDVGHFADALASPLLEESQAFNMVERYYDALLKGDREELVEILSDRFVWHGSANTSGADVDSFIDEVNDVVSGLSEAEFAVDDFFIDQNVVTVVGTVSGRHTGEIYGIAPSGRAVSFGGIAVHRVEDGRIIETWQMADRLALLRQITD